MCLALGLIASWLIISFEIWVVNSEYQQILYNNNEKDHKLKACYQVSVPNSCAKVHHGCRIYFGIFISLSSVTVWTAESWWLCFMALILLCFHLHALCSLSHDPSQQAKSSSPEARITVKQMLLRFKMTIPLRLLGDITTGQTGYIPSTPTPSWD